ncbi:MAG: helix-turn-helix transcriptional regulator [Solirubrobacteraceae bacterium]
MIRLEQLRLDAQLSPEALGKQAGVAPKAIRRLEADKGTVQVATLGKLADRFKVPASELLQPAVFRGPTDWPVEPSEGRAA